MSSIPISVIRHHQNPSIKIPYESTGNGSSNNQRKKKRYLNISQIKHNVSENLQRRQNIPTNEPKMFIPNNGQLKQYENSTFAKSKRQNLWTTNSKQSDLRDKRDSESRMISYFQDKPNIKKKLFEDESEKNQIYIEYRQKIKPKPYDFKKSQNMKRREPRYNLFSIFDEGLNNLLNGKSCTCPKNQIIAQHEEVSWELIDKN